MGFVNSGQSKMEYVRINPECNCIQMAWDGKRSSELSCNKSLKERELGRSI